MASDLTLQIIGHVGRDPEKRTTPGGVTVCDFSVAVSESWNDATTGDRREKTTWFKVTCWRGLAETVSKHVTKGMLVQVKASEIKAEAYMGSDGEAKSSLVVTARSVNFLSRIAGDGSQRSTSGAASDEPEDLPF